MFYYFPNNYTWSSAVMLCLHEPQFAGGRVASRSVGARSERIAVKRRRLLVRSLLGCPVRRGVLRARRRRAVDRGSRATR